MSRSGEKKPEEKQVSRRSYLKYVAGAAVVAAVAGVGYGAYEATRPPPVVPTQTQTATQVVTSVVTAAPPTKKTYLWGEEALYLGDEFLITLSRAAQYYALDHGDKLMTLNPNLSVEAQNRDYRYLVSGAKVDGILTSPLSEEANKDAIEWAIDQGVPVVCYNTDVDTPKMPISILVSNEGFGAAVGDAIGKLMKDDGVAPKSDDYVIVVGCGTPSNPWVPKRNGGVIGRFPAYGGGFQKHYPNVEIVEIFAENASEEITKTKVTEVITTRTKPPLAIFGTNATTDVGIVEVLYARKLAVPYGTAGHVYMGSMDVPSRIRDEMIKRIVDRGADQPNLAYGFLSVYFLGLIKEKGVDALPPVGSMVVNDPSKPEGLQPDGKTYNALPQMQTHEGVLATDVNYWPGPVVSIFGHRWLQTGVYVSTPDTVATAPIWVNVVQKWLGKG